MKSDHDLLANRLRDEAASTAPRFSESLHERIIGAVQRQTAPSAGQPFFYTRVRWMLPIAAMLTLIGGLVFQQATRPSRATPRREIVAVHRSVPMPQLAVSFPSLSERTDGELLAAQYAYLDRDAVTLARFLSDQINIPPASPQHQ